jgi:hypothetical protein
MAEGEKTVERKLGVHCALCDVFLQCPDGEDEWGWLRSDQAMAFKAEHLAHGASNTVGALIRYIEKE